jgi:hypothetical protein
MHCEACGHNQPDPKPVVIEKVKEVEVGDNALYARIATYIFLFVIAVATGLTVEALTKQRTLQKAIETPSIKVEQTEYDANGRPTLKIQR